MGAKKKQANKFKPTVNVEEILSILSSNYPDAHCELTYRTPFQLLVATMLSAQSTDKTVNRITDKLFLKYPSLKDFLKLPQEALEKEIKEIGIYRNKAKNILAMCNELETRFEGEVPSDMEALVSLPGVGRKTANVVLSNAFGIPALAVDTHVFRVSNRLGLAESDKGEETEEQLMNCIPRERWSNAHHWLIWHGRRICEARKPKCIDCPLTPFCRYYNRPKL
ncbi:MAG: nth [Clostridiales bacterium]|nr:nth [Clostridiales bacterium]